MSLNGIGMNSMINFGQISTDIPPQDFAFILLEPLKFLDQVEFEFYRHPVSKLKSDIFLSVGSSIATRFRDNPDSISFLYPLFRLSTKGLKPASFLNCSNSTSLASRLCNLSHRPSNSIEFLLRSQLLTISALPTGTAALLCLRSQ